MEIRNVTTPPLCIGELPIARAMRKIGTRVERMSLSIFVLPIPREPDRGRPQAVQAPYRETCSNLQHRRWAGGFGRAVLRRMPFPVFQRLIDRKRVLLPSASKDHAHCLEKDLDIQPHSPVVDVVGIEVNVALKGRIGASLNLP